MQTKVIVTYQKTTFLKANKDEVIICFGILLIKSQFLHLTSLLLQTK